MNSKVHVRKLKKRQGWKFVDTWLYAHDSIKYFIFIAPKYDYITDLAAIVDGLLQDDDKVIIFTRTEKNISRLKEEIKLLDPKIYISFYYNRKISEYWKVSESDTKKLKVTV